jgi:glyoxylase-like metal-dependent hydrolase (beta-lactamase superfamily II)
VRAALAEQALGPDDLAWIVLTHIHLDHCGACGDLAREFPRATVVVHPRGARHLIEPAQLIARSWEVYGELGPMHGGLTPVAEERIVTADDGHEVRIGPGRALRAIHAPGHAWHHMALLDTATGAVMAGDSLGVQFPGSELYPAIPAPQFDLEAAQGTLATLAALQPTALMLGHFGAVPDVEQALADSRERQTRSAEAARAAWPAGGEEAVRAAIATALPLESVVTDGPGLERWRRMQWADNNVGGLAGWAERQQRAEEERGTLVT